MIIKKIKQNVILRKLIINVLKIISYLNKIVPKNKNKILLYDSARNFLDDNTEALYSYLIENNYDKKYKIICCVPNERGNNSKYKNVRILRGIYHYLTSKYVFFSFGDFRIEPSSKQIVINQWHGSPIKKLGKMTSDKNYLAEKLDNFTFLLSASEFFTEVLSKSFGCSKDKIKIMGNTRNDYLFSKKETLKILGIKKEKYKKLILWMPTFRKSNDNRFNDGDTKETETMLPILDTFQDMEKLNNMLKKEKLLLIIKVHPLAIFKEKNYSNIKVIVNDNLKIKNVKLYEFIKEFDALITDYSSIYFDYLLLNRPIAFTLDDYEIYQKSRGFSFENIKDYLAGHHVYKYEDLIKFIEDLSKEKDIYENHRVEMSNLFNYYQDNLNCKRFLEEVGIK